MSLKNDLTKGDLNKQILFFSMPIVLSNLFQALYNAVDLYFVGKYVGNTGAAAVAVSGPVMNVLFMAVSGMSLSVTILIGSIVGLNDEKRLKEVANTAITMFLLAAVGLTVLGLFLTPHILRWISTPEEAMPFAVGYLNIIFMGMIFTLGYNLVCALQRGFGDSKSSLYFVIVATITNIVLDYVFIKELHMDVYGAAYATVIGQAVAFVLSIIYFISKKHVVTFNPKEFILNKEVTKEIIRIGLPSALQQVIINMAYLALSGIANSYGLIATTAYGICVKLDNFAILPCTAVSDAVAAVTSQNLGANQKERALEGIKAGRKLIIPFNIILMIVMTIFAKQLTGLFSHDMEVIAMASRYIKISCWMYIIYATYYPLMGFIKGTGNTLFGLKNTIVAQSIIRVPVAYFVSKVLGFGFYGLAAGWIAAPIWSTIVYTVYIRSGKWYTRFQGQKLKSAKQIK